MEYIGLLIKYFLIISTAGSLILLIFSIMAYCNMEALDIRKGKKNKSGTIVLVSCIIYIIITIFLFIKNQKFEEEERKKNKRENSMNLAENLNSINKNSSPVHSVEKSEDDEDKKSVDGLLI